jgi:hypothetical protein
MFTSAIGNAISGKMPSNMGQFLLPGVQGAIGGGIANAIGGAFAGMGSFAGKGLLQAGTHALSGGLQSAAFGGNFWQGAASSGISSGFASGSDALGLGGVGQLLGGGLSGGLSSELFGGNFWDGARDGLIVSGLNHLSHGGGETKVEGPGTLEGFIPIWGSGRQAYSDFQNGDYGWGTVNTAMAVSDVFLVKSIATAAGKGVWKFGSHSWNATRKWMLKRGYAGANEPLHHWAISQKVAKRYGIESVTNQPWNLMKFTSQSMHMRAGHGMNFMRKPAYGTIGQLWHGTPTWSKSVVGSYGGRTIEQLNR